MDVNAEQRKNSSLRCVTATARIMLVLLLSLIWGCGADSKCGNAINSDGTDKLSAYKPYAAEKIEITPLTEVVAGDTDEETKVKVYVSLSDSCGSQIKTPGIFRFELYSFVPRSAKPKGRRLHIWPDIDLADNAENSKYWRDFLRSYEFILDYEYAGQRVILEVTCICPNGRRLSNEIELRDM